MAAYYNEHDSFAAAWLRELIADDLIAPGEVDERSIEDVEASDLGGFVQCHFFAGIGVWSLASARLHRSRDGGSMIPSHIVLAVDPGKTGAIAAFQDGRLCMIHDPADGSLTRRFADLLLDCLDFRHRVTVVIEKVNGVPGQSGPGSFNFGKGFGELLGVCVGLGVVPVLVPPATWKWKMGLRGADKKASLEMARGEWANKDWFRRAKDDGRAEAALLGLHWLREHGGKQC